MKSIAFIFSHSPHGTSFGRETLDLILAVSAITEDIGLFFIGDGVFQLLKYQNSKKIFSRNYASAFCILPLYDICQFYCCSESMLERGLSSNYDFLVNVKVLDMISIREYLSIFDIILNF